MDLESMVKDKDLQEAVSKLNRVIKEKLDKNDYKSDSYQESFKEFLESHSDAIDECIKLTSTKK